MLTHSVIALSWIAVFPIGVKRLWCWEQLGDQILDTCEESVKKTNGLNIRSAFCRISK